MALQELTVRRTPIKPKLLDPKDVRDIIPLPTASPPPRSIS